MSDWLLTDGLAPSAGDALTPLYAAAAEGVLELPHCVDCSLALELEQQVCDGCGGPRTVWRAVEPRGVVHSATLVHRREPGLVRTDRPYPVADVELVSGHRLVLTSVEPTDHAPAIGEPVAIGFRRLGAVTVPAFRRHDQPQTEVSS